MQDSILTTKQKRVVLMGYYCDTCKQLLFKENQWRCFECEEKEEIAPRVERLLIAKKGEHYTAVNRIEGEDRHVFYQVIVRHKYGTRSETFPRTVQGLKDATASYEEYKRVWI